MEEIGDDGWKGSMMIDDAEDGGGHEREWMRMDAEDK